ncbi:type I-F CRISPR-associated protein Csy1 [Methylococcus geothermalis]|uniref:type I-F CRISPR-associated protein Csy1 n=1 Tax=Methylococcus geothermalis TaxID=2681310 RepID=UPI001CB72463|nr:type I-F CRISPR-associated protein Csy1 [Methylococcus geothermalis]
MSQPADSSLPIREAIAAFLQERLQAKLDKLKDGQDEERRKLQEAFRPENWIADAARRVGQIQQVTHALKYSHPDARGSSLSSSGNPQADAFSVGTHSLGARLPTDVVGNAAALDVHKFLSLESDGATLLQRCIAEDPAVSAAFSDDPAAAEAWIGAFARVVQPKGKPASHSLAKQIYWPLGQGRYHLLAPLFPTSLAHTVWERLSRDRYSDEAKAARQARREQRSHPHGYCEYPDLAIQKFGGTKPQNISQLNSERRGENWLLPAVPPQWQSPPVTPPLNVISVFPRRFGSRRAVRGLVQELKGFLISVADKDRNNVRIRDKRNELIRGIVSEAIQFAAEIQELDGGWSLDERCRLNEAERCWLDPGRAETDAEFASRRLRGEWKDEICIGFSLWLNASLRSDELPMGQAEALEWQSLLAEELHHD